MFKNIYLKNLPVEQGRDSGPLKKRKNSVKYSNTTLILYYKNVCRYIKLEIYNRFHKF
jgi:hypothetical protein